MAHLKPTSAKKIQKKKSFKKITDTYLHNSGLYYLQRFTASSRQFRDVMLRKVKRSCMHHEDQNFEICTAMVDNLIEKFERSGLLNDDLYTQGMVTSLRRQGKSKRAIIGKLTSKGIVPELAQEKLSLHDEEDSHNSSDAELKAAIILVRKKKLGPFKVNPDLSDKKALGSLARAGFSFDIAKYALNIDIVEAEEIIRLP